MNTPSLSKDNKLSSSSSYPPSSTIVKNAQTSKSFGRVWTVIYSYTFGAIDSLFLKKQSALPLSNSPQLILEENITPESDLELTTQEQKKEFEFLFQQKQSVFSEIYKNSRNKDYFYYEKTEQFPYSFIRISEEICYIFLKTRSRRMENKKYPKIGQSSNATVTLCYNYGINTYKACRSVRKEIVKKRELELNRRLMGSLTDSLIGDVLPSPLEIENKPETLYRRYFATAEIYSYAKSGKDQNKPWKQGEKYAFIMTYYEKGDLEKALCSDVLAPLLEKKRRDLVRHIGEALDILHSELKWVWNDLKPANILLTNDLEPRLTDFGSACKLNEKCNPGFTPLYKCPEDTISAKRDIWSLGVLLIDLIRGPNKWKQAMFPEAFTFQILTTLSCEEEMNKLLHQLLPENTRNDPKHIDGLIYKCLQYNPDNRPSAKEFLELLEIVEF